MSFFLIEAEGNSRRMTFFEEIMNIEGFTIDEMLKARELIINNKHKVDFFFVLQTEFRIHYVHIVLDDFHVYQPSCEFDLGGESG